MPATNSRLQQAAHSSRAAFLMCNYNNQTEVGCCTVYAIPRKMLCSAMYIYATHTHTKQPSSRLHVTLALFSCYTTCMSTGRALQIKESIHSTYTLRYLSNPQHYIIVNFPITRQVCFENSAVQFINTFPTVIFNTAMKTLTSKILATSHNGCYD